jgi:hypothetical protein
MEKIKANATLNLKEQPQTLTVNGSFLTYRADDIVKIEKPTVQGIVGSTLILNIKVINGDGPMKGTYKSFDFESSEKSVSNYNKVEFHYEKDEVFTIDIDTLG